MKKSKNILDLLNTRYILTIYLEENFESKVTLQLNYIRILICLSILLIVFTSLGLAVSTTLLSKVLTPSIKQKELENQVLDILTTIDTLNYLTAVNDKYVNTLQSAFDPEKTIQETENLYSKADTDKGVNTTLIEDIKTEELNFRREYEEQMLKDVIYKSQEEESNFKNHLFFPPVNSLDLVISKYGSFSNRHYGIDISGRKHEQVLAIGDGTVIFAYWTDNDGFIIGIQHDDNFISIYKHNDRLLKKQGDKVAIAEPIAIMGNTGTNTSGRHLHFELWYKGNPIDPTTLIHF